MSTPRVPAMLNVPVVTPLALSEICVASLRSENVVPLAMPVTAPLANPNSA